MAAFWALWALLGRFLGALERLLVSLGWILGTFSLPGALQASILQGLGRVGLGFGGLEGHVSACILYHLTVVAPCFYLRSNHALSFTCAFGASPPVRRSVHRTSAASRRESRACQIQGPSSKNAFLKNIAKISSQGCMASCLPSCLPPILFPSPQGRTDR